MLDFPTVRLLVSGGGPLTNGCCRGTDPDGAGVTGNGRRTSGGEFDQSAVPAFHGSATALCPAVTCCYDHCLDA